MTDREANVHFPPNVSQAIPQIKANRKMAETNGKINGASLKQHRFNPEFTKSVIAATGPKANPRMRQIMPGLLTHIHDFLRENEVTVEEWMSAVDLVSSSHQRAQRRH